MNANDQKELQFKVQFDGTPNQNMTYQVVVFDRDKKPIYQSAVKENNFSLPFSAENLKDKRVFLAPQTEARKTDISIDKLEKGNGFEVSISAFENTREPIILNPIPEYIWCWWLFCFCHVRGRVFNRCGNEYLPVYKARVHICEVDPVIWYLQKLPDYEIVKLRDDILAKLIDWHLPDPPPDALKKININPAARISASQQQIAANTRSFQFDKSFSTTDTRAISPTLPQENLAYFYSGSASLIRNYFTDNYRILYPYWCWLSPWFLRCDEVAVIETDANGWFNTDIWYLCCGDKPDLYFWVEYYINGVWTTVYSPGLRCATHWDYSCNTEVDIYLNDQRIPCPIPQPPIGFKDVFVFSIGNNISVTKVYQDGAMAGETMSGAYYDEAHLSPVEEGSPFGGSIEPRVYFGSYLCDSIDGGNNYFYKWSFRKEGTSDWNDIITDTFRHYLVETSDGPIFPAYRIGANNDKLYKILRYHLPAADGGNDLWVAESRTDTASTKFITTDLNNDAVADDFSATDGVYEIKMELYKYVGTAATRVNWTAEGINLYVPLNTLPSPFGDVTIAHETDSTIINKYKYFEGTDLYGFKMKIFIDNKPCDFYLEDVIVTNTDGTSGAAGECGFIEFKDREHSSVNFKFKAAQQNNFATWGFEVIKGNGSVYFTAGGRAGISTADFIRKTNPATADTDTGNDVTLNGSGEYELHVSPKLLLENCNKAAFLQSASVHPLVQDGYSRLYSDSSLATAFALEHHNASE